MTKQKASLRIVLYQKKNLGTIRGSATEPVFFAVADVIACKIYFVNKSSLKIRRDGVLTASLELWNTVYTRRMAKKHGYNKVSLRLEKKGI